MDMKNGVISRHGALGDRAMVLVPFAEGIEPACIRRSSNTLCIGVHSKQAQLIAFRYTEYSVLDVHTRKIAQRLLLPFLGPPPLRSHAADPICNRMQIRDTIVNVLAEFGGFTGNIRTALLFRCCKGKSVPVHQWSNNELACKGGVSEGSWTLFSPPRSSMQTVLEDQLSHDYEALASSATTGFGTEELHSSGCMKELAGRRLENGKS
ncbi:hypothetical protein CISG_01208 [Coccidioides immitis RMSCC 3703]|uniref:Uncharacterized protein n=2 Tax=Coccidioides immitis TaxID=5501 RepID=A0A0J8QWQ4_COCIT|nr:hypothetical protein CIRG_01688 [Coccidioides immitis RMSCC 2394]KMU76475.1 hypothetical protein CISG_01208 [Coccidioides immitis RMSCC 3703]